MNSVDELQVQLLLQTLYKQNPLYYAIECRPGEMMICITTLICRERILFGCRILKSIFHPRSEFLQLRIRP